MERFLFSSVCFHLINRRYVIKRSIVILIKFYYVGNIYIYTCFSQVHTDAITVLPPVISLVPAGPVPHVPGSGSGSGSLVGSGSPVGSGSRVGSGSCVGSGLGAVNKEKWLKS